MSIFSSIRRSRQHAKETKTAAVEREKKETNTTPYRHVPTHAAIDAIACAPPSWRTDDDRVRIVEQNRRRSAMVSSSSGMASPTGYSTPGGGYGGYGGYNGGGGARYINMNMTMNMSMPGIMPRANSSLSNVEYVGAPSGGGADFSPAAHLPRAYSYNGVSPYRYLDQRTSDHRYADHRSRDVVYSIADVDASGAAPIKGKAVDVSVSAPAAYEVAPQGISPASSKDERSPNGSASDSGSSQDDLEMRGLPSVDHLAASSSNRGYSSGYASSRETRSPPTTTRGFSAIPASAVPRPLQPGILPGHLSPSTAVDAVPASGAATSGMPASRQSSAASLPALTPSSSRYASAPVTPAALPTVDSEFPLNNFSLPGPDLDLVTPDAAAPAGKQKERRLPKTTRFTELARIESSVEAPPSHRLDPPPPEPLPATAVVNAFPEPAAEPEPASAPKSKGRKLTKGGGKLTKKNRRSAVVAA